MSADEERFQELKTEALARYSSTLDPDVLGVVDQIMEKHQTCRCFEDDCASKH